jgi:threonine/homoserine/homoserine lactone efflux protein
MLLVALVGFLVGWIGSVPVAGPISALVVTRGIDGRFRSGAYIAIGGAVVEALYALLAFWGFSHFLTRYPIVVPISHCAGAVILAVLGIGLLRRKPSELSKAPDVPRDTAMGSLLLGASICAFNPTLIATWTAVVTTLYAKMPEAVTTDHALPFALGVCLGIAGWFGSFLGLIHRFKQRFSLQVIDRVVRAIGAFLLVVAAWFAWQMITYFL